MKFWQDCLSIKTTSIDGCLICQHTFKVAFKRSFHVEKWCHLVSAHVASARHSLLVIVIHLIVFISELSTILSMHIDQFTNPAIIYLAIVCWQTLVVSVEGRDIFELKICIK